MENKELSLVKSIKFTRRKEVAEQLRRHKRPEWGQCGKAIMEARRLSRRKGLMMAKGFLDNAGDSIEDFHSMSKELIHYGKRADIDTRRTIVQAIIQNNGRVSKMYMVHSISSMQKNDARTFMKDYFESGGDIDSVMLWLSEAGKIIRDCQTKPDGTAGKVIKKAKEAFDWIADKCEDAWDTITQGVKAVVDAVVSAGKTIGECIKKIYNWTKEQIKDVIRALVEVGKTVKEIAKEIAKECRDILNNCKKFFVSVIDGLKSVGKNIGEFFVELYNNSKDVFKAAIQAIKDTVSDVRNLIENVAKQVYDKAKGIIKEIINAGIAVGSILKRAVECAYDVFKSIGNAIKDLGYAIGEFVKAAYYWSKDQINNLVKFCKEIGYSIKNFAVDVAKTCKTIINSCKKFIIDVIDGLKSVGQKIGEFFVELYNEARDVFKAAIKAIKDTLDDIKTILEDVAKLVYSKVKVIVDAIVEAGVAIGSILKKAAECAYEVFKAIGNAIKDLGHAIGEFVKEAYYWSKNQIKNLMKFCKEIGYSIKNFAVDVAKSCRDFFVMAYNECKSFIKKTIECIKEIGLAIGEFVVNVYNTAKELLSIVVDALKTLAIGIKDAIVYAAKQTYEIAAKFISALKEIGISVVSIIKDILVATYEVVKTTFKVLIATGTMMKDIIVTLFSDPKNLKTNALKALKELKGSVKGLFNEMYSALNNSINDIVRNFKSIGATVEDVVLWSIDKGTEIYKDALDALTRVGTSAVDIFKSIAQTGIEFARSAVDFFFSVSQSCVNIVKAAIECSAQMGKNVFNLVLENTSHVAKLVKEVSVSTYKYTQSFVKDLYQAGVKTCQILAMVAKASYTAFRRVVTGIVKNLGPIGEIMDWVFTQAENVTSKIWEDSIQAIKYAGGKTADIVTWALKKGETAITAVYNGWETSKNALAQLYTITFDGFRKGVVYSLEKVGEATARLNNDVDYFLTFVKEDCLTGVSSIVKGLFKGGLTIGKIVADTIKLGTKAVFYTVSGLIEAGCGLTEIIVEFIMNPKASIKDMLSSLEKLKYSLTDVFRAIKDESISYKEKIVDTYYNELKVAAYDIMNGAIDLGYGVVGEIASVLMNHLTYNRKLYKVEIEEAKRVFGNSIDYSKVRLTEKFKSDDLAQSWKRIVDKIISKCQDKMGDSGRPFTVGTTIHFDPSDGVMLKPKGVDSILGKTVGKHFYFPTLIHELTHVWQYMREGESYMLDALVDQFTDEGYIINEAFAKIRNANEQVTQENSNSLFHKYFNLEQQGKVIEFCYCLITNNDDVEYHRTNNWYDNSKENYDDEIKCLGKLVYG